EVLDRVYVEEAFATISVGSGGVLENTILITDFTPSQDVLDFSDVLNESGRYVLTHDEVDDVASAKDLYAALEIVDDLLSEASAPGISYTTFVFEGSTYIYADNDDPA